MDKIPLATDQPGSEPINTRAEGALARAQAAYHNGDMVESATLFLHSIRVLQYEQESYMNEILSDQALLFHPYHITLERLELQSYKRICMLCASLHDFAIACYFAKDKKYLNDEGCPQLDVFAWNKSLLGNETTGKDDDKTWLGNTTTDEIEYEGKLWPAGSSITRVLPLKDPIGRLLSEAKSFKEASNVAAHYCCIRASFFHQSDFPCYNLIKSNMPWIVVLTSQNLDWVKRKGLETLEEAAAQSEKDGKISPWISQSLKDQRQARRLAESWVRSAKSWNPQKV